MFNPEGGQVSEKREVIQYMCAECKTITKDVSEEDKINPDVVVRVSHGLCRDCYNEQLKELHRPKV